MGWNRGDKFLRLQPVQPQLCGAAVAFEGLAGRLAGGGRGDAAEGSPSHALAVVAAEAGAGAETGVNV